MKLDDGWCCWWTIADGDDRLCSSRWSFNKYHDSTCGFVLWWSRAVINVLWCAFGIKRKNFTYLPLCRSWSNSQRSTSALYVQIINQLIGRLAGAQLIFARQSSLVPKLAREHLSIQSLNFSQLRPTHENMSHWNSYLSQHSTGHHTCCQISINNSTHHKWITLVVVKTATTSPSTNSNSTTKPNHPIINWPVVHNHYLTPNFFIVCW